MLINLVIVIFLYPAKSIAITNGNGYQYSLLGKDIDDLCNSQTCNGESHTMCTNSSIPECEDFSEMKIHGYRKKSIMYGHNGIRNRVAIGWKISNMLYLHWDRNLEHMARKHMQKCLIEKDTCDFIYNPSITVGQNYYFIRKPPSERWAVIIIRKWFLEFGSNKSFSSFEKTSPANLTQLIWPTTKFVGCAAVRIGGGQGGHGLVCNYSPSASYNYSDFQFDAPCSGCPFERPTCSRVFSGLCGKDVEAYGGAFGTVSNFPQIMYLLIILWYPGHQFL